MGCSDLAGLERVLLEDSWVFDIAPSERQIAFRIEAVLLPGHSAHTDPKPGEICRYQSGWLRWRAPGSRANVDPGCRRSPLSSGS